MIIAKLTVKVNRNSFTFRLFFWFTFANIYGKICISYLYEKCIYKGFSARLHARYFDNARSSDCRVAVDLKNET